MEGHSVAKINFGRVLREHRQSRGMSLYQLSRDTGLRFEQAKAIEQGEGYSPNKLFLYLELLGVEITIRVSHPKQEDDINLQ